VIAVHRQNQRIAFFEQAKTQVRAFGDDPLVTHQALEAFGQGVAGHQGIAGHMERGRAHHLAHVQADRRVAGQLDRRCQSRVMESCGKRASGSSRAA
jgi:hypothetical protein